MPPKKPASKKVAPANTAPAASTNSPSSTLSWPALTPLLPPEDLRLETVLEEQILTIPRFFTATLCKSYHAFLQKTVTLTKTPGKLKRGEALRVNDRFQLQDEAFAKILWEKSGLREIIAREGEAGKKLWGGEVVGLNPNIRVYRYSKGQFFDKHYDDSNTFSFGDPPVPCRTTWTLLLYLTGSSDGVVGGETVFYTEATKTKKSEEIVVDLEKGLAVLHRHGRECLLHEGRVVTEDAGIGKWVLRSDLVVQR
ncbi:hypothetical protein RUND412_009907 [Rhizina undulata]